MSSQFKDLKLYPNMPELRAQFVFDSPKVFDMPPKGGKDAYKRYAYKLRLLSDFGEFHAGDEVSYWTSLDKELFLLNQFKRGTQVKIMYPQGAGERFATLDVRPLGLAEEEIYSEKKQAEAAPATPPVDSSDLMADALVEGYTAIRRATAIIEERFDEEAGNEFAAAMMSGDIIQKTGVSVFIQKTQRKW